MRPSSGRFFFLRGRQVNVFRLLLCALIYEIFSLNAATSQVHTSASQRSNYQSHSSIISQTFTDQNNTLTSTTVPDYWPTPSLMQLIQSNNNNKSQTKSLSAMTENDANDDYANSNLGDASTTVLTTGAIAPSPPPVVGSISRDYLDRSKLENEHEHQQRQTLLPQYKFQPANTADNHLQNVETPSPDLLDDGMASAASSDATMDTALDEDKPDTRLKLAEYIFVQFHEHDVGSLLDTNRNQLEGNFKALLGPNPPPAEPLIEIAGASSAAAASVASLNGSSSAVTLAESGAHMVVEHHHQQLAANGTNATIGGAHVDRPFYGDTFQAFTVNYWQINCATCLVICAVGIFANLMNMVVLTRPNMVSAVNTILCAIACSDFIVNLSNIPYLIHELSDNSNAVTYYSYGWAFYILMHAHVTVTAHTISIWLTCALATWRYLVLSKGRSSQRDWSVGLALRVIASVVIFVPIICIPNYLSFAIVEDKADNGAYIYKVGFSHLADTSRIIKTFHFWIFSCLTKLLPCCLLTIFTTVLIRKLLSARERRLRLTAGSNQNRCSSACATAGTPIEPARKVSAPNGQLFRRASSRKKNKDAGAHLESDKQQNVANGISNGAMAIQSNNSGTTNSSAHKRESSEPEVLVQVTGCQGVVATSCAPAVSRLVQQVAIGAPHELMHHEDDEFRHACGGISSVGNDEQHCASSMRHQQQQQQQQHNPLAPHQAHKGMQPGVCRVHGVRHQLSTTPLSNSSCATDAECLPGSATSSGSDNMSLSDGNELVCRQQGHLHPPNRAIVGQQQQQLLVETRQDASAPTCQIVSTLAHAGGPPPVKLAGNNEMASAQATGRGGTAIGQPHCGSGRSASTCGALDLYAINNSNGNGSLCVASASSGLKRVSQERDDQLDSSATSLIERNARPLSFRLANRGERAVSATPIVGTGGSGGANHKASQPLGQKPDGARTERGRSAGSASFAPLQIVKFQATHRQLSQNETTTRLLIAVIIVFLICESPAGILAALCAVFGADFFENVYQPMGIVTDLLALINSAVNFVLYCFMSTQFRVTFYQVVLRCPAPTPPNKQRQQQTHKQQVAANRY